jgi:hypothetical protein
MEWPCQQFGVKGSMLNVSYCCYYH